MRASKLMAVVASLALLVAACSDDGDGDAAGGNDTTESPEDVMEVVSQAAADTLDMETARVTLEAARDDGDEEVSATGETFLEIEEDFAADRRAFSMGDAQEPVIVVDGADAYVRQLDGEGEDTWLRIDIAQAAEEGLALEGLPDGFPFRESRQVLEALRDGEGEATALETDRSDTDAATETGTETGTEGDTDAAASPVVDRYEVVLDVEATGGAGEGEEGGTNEWLRRAAERSPGEGLEVEVGVDDEGLVREVVYTIAPPADDDATTTTTADADGDGDATTTTTIAEQVLDLVAVINYDDLGAELAVDVPEGENVSDVEPEEIRQGLSEIPLGVVTEPPAEGDGGSTTTTTAAAPTEETQTETETGGATVTETETEG